MNRYLKAAAMLAAITLVAAGAYWYQNKPAPDELAMIAEEETPLGAPALNDGDYLGGYGIRWAKDAEGFSGSIDGEAAAKLMVPAATPMDELVVPGMTRSDAEKILGLPTERVGNTRIGALNSATKSYYSSGDQMYLLHFDTLTGNKVLFITELDSQLASETRFFTSSEWGPVNVEDAEAMTLDLINQLRIDNGKSPLQLDLQIASVARAHSRSMLDGNYFSHDSPSGQTPRDRLRAGGIQFKRSGEALCAGTWTPMDAVTAWMNSPAHRDILMGDYTAAGVGIASGSSGYGIYFTFNAVSY